MISKNVNIEELEQNKTKLQIGIATLIALVGSIIIFGFGVHVGTLIG